MMMTLMMTIDYGQLVNKIIQAKNSIPWVRCASGNVLLICKEKGLCISYEVLIPLSQLLNSMPPKYVEVVLFSGEVWMQKKSLPNFFLTFPNWRLLALQ